LEFPELAEDADEARVSPGLETLGWNGTKSAFADYASALATPGGIPAAATIVRVGRKGCG
jgi:hypothetical protein